MATDLNLLPRVPPRVADWPERLAAYIEARRHMPFAWGRNDCVSFAAGAVRAVTGAHLSELLPVAWGDGRQAARALRQMGGVQQAVTRVLGAPRVGPGAGAVRRGGVVCVVVQGQATTGVAAGNGCWCAPGAEGLVFRPMAEVQVSWEI